MHAGMETVDYADQNSISRQSYTEKYRVQVPAVLFATVFLQVLFAEARYGLSNTPISAWSSISLALGTNLVGLLYYRGMRPYPGARKFAFIFSSFILSWSGAFVLLLVLRLPYSSSHLAVAFATGLLVMVLLNLWNRKLDSVHFVMVPSTRVRRIVGELPWLNHTVCRVPEDIFDHSSIIVADLHAELQPNWSKALADAALRGNPIFHFKHITESLTGRVQIEHLSENPLGRLAPTPSYGFFKQLCERCLAAIALIVLLPLLMTLMLMIRLDSDGSPIFSQKRVGYRGQQFTMFKLRTMVEHRASASLEDEITVHNDPRITRLGRFLRNSRLDELPQLLNVVLGEMSLIGPRPETVQLSALYDESLDFYSYRHVVRPGITGWAQINQGHVATTDEVKRKLQYDFYYIKHFSLWLDVVIAIRTVQVMLLKSGAR